jgi:chromosomal replication initiator protein
MRRAVVASFTVGAEPPVWAPLASALRKALPAERARDLLGGMQPLESPPSILRVAVARERLGAWLRSGALIRVDSLTRSLSGDGCALAVIPVDGEPSTGQDPTQTLARFVASPSNHGALEAARAFLAGDPERSRLFVRGPLGAGKTHLLRGIAGAAREWPHDAPALYRSARSLSMELASAIRAGRAGDVRKGLLGASALLIDDLGILAERDATRRELELVLRRELSEGKPLILASDLPAEALSALGAAFRDAIGTAWTVELAPPEWETRVAILFDRASAWGVELGADVASTLATGVGEDLHRLDAVLTRLMLLRRGEHGDADVDLARRALSSGPLHSPSPSPETILDVVARRFGLRRRDLRAPGRTGGPAAARQLAAYLLRTHCALSLPQIGRRLGRHHTSALSSVRSAQRKLRHDASFAGLVALVEKEILASGEKER